ncbi:zinc finger protein 414 isoform X2 [Archocentrus centrarchus]|uniref:zinc finger protein 414 isoform X2 n=1 Tax=Archocentrus centrarchus TaxID=63155 RepID=UPI0011E9D110|nr:zinc finger protein 414 isoform X2 [Archocentrus centrarchus]
MLCGNKRIPCPLHGCKRVYSDTSALESHIKDHEIPAQSLPGKVLLCSTVGCSGSFSSMQKLMEHMRHHHKPNIFFQCESCRTKLRSYRGLLTHLHTCSKVPRGKSKPPEQTPPQAAAVTNPNIAPRLESVSAPQQLPSHIPNPDGAIHPADPQADSSSPALLGSSGLPLPETSSQQTLMEKAPNIPPSLNMDGSQANPDPPDFQGQHQTQTRSPEPIHPSPVSTPHSPPGLSAVWKKNQGVAYSRRILWEHTRGRYTCVQCGHMVTNRKEMTQHINSQHSSIKAVEDTGSSATKA